MWHLKGKNEDLCRNIMAVNNDKQSIFFTTAWSICKLHIILNLNYHEFKGYSTGAPTFHPIIVLPPFHKKNTYKLCKYDGKLEDNVLFYTIINKYKWKLQLTRKTLFMEQKIWQMGPHFFGMDGLLMLQRIYPSKKFGKIFSRTSRKLSLYQTSQITQGKATVLKLPCKGCNLD